MAVKIAGKGKLNEFFPGCRWSLKGRRQAFITRKYDENVILDDWIVADTENSILTISTGSHVDITVGKEH